VQDTGPDGGRWALVLRGVDAAELGADTLVSAWTIRGAPHLYRREDLPSVAAAVAPFSHADAYRRIYDAAKPLKAAGIGGLAALDAVADAMRSVVTQPRAKGEVSTRMTALMEPPYLRFCRPCDTTHLFEMPFRLGALRAGLELRAGTSPPVLERIPNFDPAPAPDDRHDVIRAYLRLLGPATPKHVAEYLDAPTKEVTARWPTDTVEVKVEGRTRWVLARRIAPTSAPGRPARPGCSDRSTCSSRPETGRCWSTTQPGRRRCGPFWAVRAPSWWTAGSRVSGDRASRVPRSEFR
jgi:hypothetical protein